MVLLHLLLTLCTAAILAPFSYYAGQGARYLRLPQITGYLLSGIVCGPFLLGILSKESVTELNIIEGACLSIIGLAAGAELDLASLQRTRKQVSHPLLSCRSNSHTLTRPGPPQGSECPQQMQPEDPAAQHADLHSQITCLITHSLGSHADACQTSALSLCQCISSRTLDWSSPGPACVGGAFVGHRDHDRHMRGYVAVVLRGV